MTDRYCAFVVTLEKDMRDDDAEAIAQALGMISGVLSVEPVGASPWDDSAFKACVREFVRAAFVKALEEMGGMIASRNEAVEIRVAAVHEQVVRIVDEKCRSALAGVLVPGSLPVVQHPGGVVWCATRWDGDTLHGVLEVPVLGSGVVPRLEVKP